MSGPINHYLYVGEPQLVAAVTSVLLPVHDHKSLHQYTTTTQDGEQAMAITGSECMQEILGFYCLDDNVSGKINSPF